jgi:hypothetical protein
MYNLARHKGDGQLNFAAAHTVNTHTTDTRRVRRWNKRYEISAVRGVIYRAGRIDHQEL